jgi:hypothetical protein
LDPASAAAPASALLPPCAALPLGTSLTTRLATGCFGTLRALVLAFVSVVAIVLVARVRRRRILGRTVRVVGIAVIRVFAHETLGGGCRGRVIDAGTGSGAG